MSKVISVRVPDKFYDKFKQYALDHSLSPLERGWILRISLIRGFRSIVDSGDSLFFDEEVSND